MAHQLILTMVVCAFLVRPSTQTYADEVCAEAGAVRMVDFRETNGASERIGFGFECNKAKDAITKCISRSHNGAFVVAGAKGGGFGGYFGNKFTADCSAIDGPSNVVEQNFGEQVCSTTKEKAKLYANPSPAAAPSERVKVTFFCDGMKIAFCKPDKGKIGKIKAGKTELVGGVVTAKFYLFCQETKEPELHL